MEIGHYDLSLGNVLLTKEKPCSEFMADAVIQHQFRHPESPPATFNQRPLDLRDGGCLHDFDMARQLPSPDVGATPALVVRSPYFAFTRAFIYIVREPYYLRLSAH